MASLDYHGKSYRVCFRLPSGQQIKRSLDTDEERTANRLLAILEDNLARAKQGRLVIPESADPITFLLSDGKVEQVAVEKPASFGELVKQYQKEVLHKEKNTLYTERMHLKHLTRLIGSRTSAKAVTQATVQDYIDERAKEPGRRGKVSHVTIKKEVATLTSLWRWAAAKSLAPPLTVRGLRYDKTREKPPFQTWKQIERQIKRGASDELWDSVYLTAEEVAELLAHVKEHATAHWVYPMFVCAAHTGMRRSELLRSEREDFDFEAGLVKVREKKKDRTRRFTFRHVPLSGTLKSVMKAYFNEDAASPFTFVTGARGNGTRPANQTVVHAFKKSLKGSKWEVLTGWHVLRHSFASLCAIKETDQRLIDEWLGHQTDEMSRRYRHLFPNAQKKALARVFQ